MRAFHERHARRSARRLHARRDAAPRRRARRTRVRPEPSACAQAGRRGMRRTHRNRFAAQDGAAARPLPAHRALRDTRQRGHAACQSGKRRIRRGDSGCSGNFAHGLKRSHSVRYRRGRHGSRRGAGCHRRRSAPRRRARANSMPRHRLHGNRGVRDGGAAHPARAGRRLPGADRRVRPQRRRHVHTRCRGAFA